MKGSMRKIVWLVCILVAGLCIGFLAHYFVRLQQNKKLYESIQSQQTVETVTQQTETVETEMESETKEKVEIPINFEELYVYRVIISRFDMKVPVLITDRKIRNFQRRV